MLTNLPIFYQCPNKVKMLGPIFGVLSSSKTLILVAIVEIIANLAQICNKFGALFAIILMSVSINAFLFDAVLDPGEIGGAVVLLILNIAVIIGYMDK